MIKDLKKVCFPCLYCYPYGQRQLFNISITPTRAYFELFNETI